MERIAAQGAGLFGTLPDVVAVRRSCTDEVFVSKGDSAAPAKQGQANRTSAVPDRQTVDRATGRNKACHLPDKL